METIASDLVANQRLQAMLMTAYGVVATLLAVIGCYGILAHMVSQRRREIGVRLALGATPAAIVGRIMAGGLKPVAFGLCFGATIALASTRVLSSLLFGVTPLDPASFIGATVMLGTVSGVAALVPARRAAATQPSRVLNDPS